MFRDKSPEPFVLFQIIAVVLIAALFLCGVTAIGVRLVSNSLARDSALASPVETPVPVTFTVPTSTPSLHTSQLPTPALADTPTPVVIAPSSTPVSVAMPTATFTPDTLTLTFMQNMNIRQGPGTDYAVIGAGVSGESALVVGRNTDSSWLVIEYPGITGTGWVYTSLVQINGNVELAAVVQAPLPPATPTYTPVPVTPTPSLPTATPRPAGPQVKVEFPEGNEFDTGETIKAVIVVRDPNGVSKFTWGVFTQNQSPLIGGDQDCHGATECKKEVKEKAPPIEGVYIIGADVTNTKGVTVRGVGEVYVR